MKFRTFLAGAVLCLALPAAAMEGVISVDDAYARASRPNAPTGAAFMTLTNHGDEDDRLIAASSGAAKMVELHTHLEDANGVMRMVEVKDGIALPAGGTAMLMRGGDHVMMMGLTQTFEQGGVVEVTLTFENTGDMTIKIPIDNERSAGHGGHGGHEGHGKKHSHGTHGAVTN